MSLRHRPNTKSVEQEARGAPTIRLVDTGVAPSNLESPPGNTRERPVCDGTQVGTTQSGINDRASTSSPQIPRSFPVEVQRAAYPSAGDFGTLPHTGASHLGPRNEILD